MQFYHCREEAERQHAIEMRVIELEDGTSRAIHLEKYIWDEYDFITGRVYGHVYCSDGRMLWRAELSAAEIGKPFDYALDQIVRLSAYVLKGKVFPKHSALAAV